MMIEQQMKYLVVDAGETFIQEGEIGKEAYIVEEGVVRVFVYRDEQLIILSDVGPGSVVGEMAIFDDGPRTASVTALKPSRLIVVTRELFKNRMKQLDPVLNMCMNVILERFRCTLTGIRDVNLTSMLSSCSRKNDQTTRFSDAIEEVILEHDLTQAIIDNELVLHFQPIIHLADHSLSGCEALVRWNHPDRGLIFPDQFISSAEKSGLITPISRWVAKNAMQGLVEIVSQSALNNQLFVSINLSGADFCEQDLASFMVRAVERSSLNPEQIKIELTESVLVEQPDVAKKTLDELKALGFSLTIDDFGTGYSSLSYLHQYNFDTLKIDKSFVQDAINSDYKRKIIESIVALAKQLDMTIVAEGIETKEHVRLMQDLGCDYAQGYYYSRPVSCDAFVGYSKSSGSA